MIKRAIIISIPIVIFLTPLLYYGQIEYDWSRYYKFVLVAVFLIGWAVLYFYELLNSENVFNLLDVPHFWIVTGIALFHTGTFMVMGLVNYTYSIDPEMATNIYSINHILNIIYYSLIAYGFYIQWKSTKSSLSS
ncbi:hypothetical protein [uncultured Arcticibacterium sp.]|uniref:hypothetical protein n=1 Tax=uncultured Arcticibacterium sp. TaxID=2173042 RepID=UPI0030FB4FF7